MNLFKSIIVTLTLAFSLGFLPTTVFAAAPTSPAEAKASINLVIGHASEAVKSIEAGEDENSIRVHIKAALRECKKITGAEQLEKKRLKVSRLFKKARTALKKGDRDKAKDYLIDAEKKFEILKEYL